jgi:hypothetical protein
MARHSRTKLVPPNMKSNQAVGITEESSVPEQKEEPMLPELELDLECPRCNDVMELNSSFDVLVYFCDSCSFVLKCV